MTVTVDLQPLLDWWPLWAVPLGLLAYFICGVVTFRWLLWADGPNPVVDTDAPALVGLMVLVWPLPAVFLLMMTPCWLLGKLARPYLRR